MSIPKKKVTVLPTRIKEKTLAEKYFSENVADIIDKKLGAMPEYFYQQLLFYSKNNASFLEELKKDGALIELNFPMYKNAKEMQIKNLQTLRYIDDVKGIKCKNCRSTRTLGGSIQARSFDEGESSLFYCENCA